MELRIMTEPQQGADYETQLAAARTAEAAGFGAYFRSDHLLAFGAEGATEVATARPVPTDTWTTLAALGRETSTIRLGAMVTSMTFRHPGMLAIQVAQADRMSGGRVELGLGAGWFETEHRAYGLPFAPIGERFDQLEEQLELITGLWSTPAGERYSFAGQHYRIEDSPGVGVPVQQPIPLIMGGVGRKRTPALAARFATEFSTPPLPRTVAEQAIGDVRAACEQAGRDPREITFGAVLTTVAGRDDREVASRAAAVGTDPAALRDDDQLAGTPAQLVDVLGAYAELGITRVYLRLLDLADLDQIEFIAGTVAPQLTPAPRV